MLTFVQRLVLLEPRALNGLQRKRSVRKIVASWLEKNGWILRNMPAFGDHADIFATRGSITVAILCSGVDKPMLQTQMEILQNFVAESRVCPVFIYGEHRNPQLWERIREGFDVILPISELDSLNEKIDKELTPTLIGFVSRVTTYQKLRGWAKLSGPGRALIEAHYDGQVIGTAVANVLRQDLMDKGDGKFGFEFSLSEPLTSSEILDDVKIKAFHETTYVGTLKYWERVVKAAPNAGPRGL